MNCKDCLTALQTESLRDMSPDSPVIQHCATCPDCARVTTMLRDKEYETATVLNNLPPMSNPLTVAETAVLTAQRRRLGRVAVMISGAALAATLWIVAVTVVAPNFDNDVRVAGPRAETIALTCLSPQQARDIISPYVSSPGSIVSAATSGISAITVRGRPTELASARELIREFENHPSAACRAPMTIIENLRKQMSEGQPHPVMEADPMPGRLPRTLLGHPGKSLLDPTTPLGSGPVVAPDKATTPLKR